MLLLLSKVSYTLLSIKEPVLLAFVGSMFLIIFFVISVIYINKNLHKDDNLPMKTYECIIIEKTRDAGTIVWFTVELSNGERKLLRNLKPDKLILAVGDKGIMEIRGQTICTFKRELG